jgi:hypothetical protein
MTILEQLLSINEDKLSQIALSADLQLAGQTMKSGTKLDVVCRKGARDEVNAALILDGVFDALAKQDQ